MPVCKVLEVAIFGFSDIKLNGKCALRNIGTFAHCPRNGDWNTFSRCTTGCLFGSGKVTKRNSA